MTRKADPTLLTVYAATHYVVNGVERPFVLRVNQCSAPLETLHQREQAEQIGRQYGQNAILWMGADAIPELVLLTKQTEADT
ncbi:MAG TPA: hypothetical protein VIZ30_10015 [Pseudomonadales bacterium]